MPDLILAAPAFAASHWGAVLTGAYLALGLRLAIREALISRREGADGPLWQTLLVVTALWPLLYAQRAVFALILAWDVMAAMREDRREARRLRRDMRRLRRVR